MNKKTATSSVTVVNMVGSGTLGVEVAVAQLAADIDDATTEYDPSNYHGLYVRFADEGPLVTVYRSGKYIITGSKNHKQLENTRDQFLQALSKLDILETVDDSSFHVQNVVCTADLEQSVNLSALAIALGLEATEYEPEQFPGLIYRPSDLPSVLLIFSSGKVVITGSPNIDTAETAFEQFQTTLESVMGSSQ